MRLPYGWSREQKGNIFSFFLIFFVDGFFSRSFTSRFSFGSNSFDRQKSIGRSWNIFNIHVRAFHFSYLPTLKFKFAQYALGVCVASVGFRFTKIWEKSDRDSRVITILPLHVIHWRIDMEIVCPLFLFSSLQIDQTSILVSRWNASFVWTVNSYEGNLCCASEWKQTWIHKMNKNEIKTISRNYIQT